MMTTAPLPPTAADIDKLVRSMTALADRSFKAGGFITAYQTFTEAAPALHAFLEFKGPGWLQTATDRTIWIHTDGNDDTFAGIPTSAWPVQGERVSPDGLTSLALRRDSAGWTLWTLGEDTTPSGVLGEEHLHAAGASTGRCLRYQIAWTPQLIGTAGPARLPHTELRPTASRFLGFLPHTPHA